MAKKYHLGVNYVRLAGDQKEELEEQRSPSIGSVIYASIGPTMNYDRQTRVLEVPSMQVLMANGNSFS